MYPKNDYRYYLYHSDMNDDYIMHHGVKGMRWGYRKDPEKTENKSNIGKKIAIGVGAAAATAALAGGAYAATKYAKKAKATTPKIQEYAKLSKYYMSDKYRKHNTDFIKKHHPDATARAFREIDRLTRHSSVKAAVALTRENIQKKKDYTTSAIIAATLGLSGFGAISGGTYALSKNWDSVMKSPVPNSSTSIHRQSNNNRKRR